MSDVQVTFVRIYLSESSGKLEDIFDLLHEREKVRGVTVFRGISGFGGTGTVHSASLLDISLDLPVVIEFFDEREKASRIINHLRNVVEPGHMAWWDAVVNSKG